jgi:predicted phosphodiesterase
MCSKVLAVFVSARRLPFVWSLIVVLSATGCSALPQAATTAGAPVTPVTTAATATPAAGQSVVVRSILPNARDSVKFLIIGDSGTGDRAQFEVAARIAEKHKAFAFDRAIMLGDNLYGRENAAAYRNKFERPYAPLLEAGVKFYASLGNHDEAAQRFYKQFNMDGKHYYTHDTDDVRFFALDSTYMSPDQLKWLEEELRRSNHKWKIAYMHHPMYSSGLRHGSTPALRTALEPLFLKYGVDVVFAGHDHFYERLRPQNGIAYFVQGGSAKLRRGNISKTSAITARGFDTDRSFTVAEIVDDQMYIETISRTGMLVDSAVITRREAAGSPSSE